MTYRYCLSQKKHRKACDTARRVITESVELGTPKSRTHFTRPLKGGIIFPMEAHVPNREEAFLLLKEFNSSESLIKHALTLQIK